MASERKRLDVLLVEKGFYATRSAARAAVMAGLVTVDGIKAAKPGMMVAEQVGVAVAEPPRYVSRGGYKLEKALRVFGVDPAGKTVIDVGASTGGFTDCLLQAGAARVYSVDVGFGQLDWKLRQDSRVVVMERTNFRHLKPEQVPEPLHLAVVDVSFISLALIFPVLSALDVPEAVVLVKPQFEAGKGKVGKKGVVRDPDLHVEVLEKVVNDAGEHGYRAVGLTFSPLKGPEGNIEYLLHLKKKAEPAVSRSDMEETVSEAHATLN